MVQTALDTLDLDPEDGIDLLEEFERGLGVTIAEAEAQAVGTMADLHALLVRKLIGDNAPTGKCASQMAFYRIRRELMRQWPRASIHPDAALKNFTAGNPRKFLAELGRRTGLRVARAPIGLAGSIGAIGAFFSALFLLASMLSGHFGILGPAIFGAFVLLIVFDRGTMPRHLANLGDLARSTGALSLAQLEAAGARVDADTVWEALVETVVQVTNVDPAEIGPHTTFHRSRKNAKAGV